MIARKKAETDVFKSLAPQIPALVFGMVFPRIIRSPGLYYISFTCHRWLSLIEIVKGYDLVYHWFGLLGVAEHRVAGYVILPNHLHLLLHFSGNSEPLNKFIGNGKRFMAYAIIRRLEQQEDHLMLDKLFRDVQPRERKRGKKHQVWMDSFQLKECPDEESILRQLHAIHHNPCSEKWKLATDPCDYPHSSASFYLNGGSARCVITDYRELLKADPAGLPQIE